MHIPDNYLSPETCAVMGVVMIPVWAYSIHKIKKDLPREKLPLIGVAAAFSFLLMMFNVPLPGGTTGHAVGGTLVALLLGGPQVACIAVSAALLIQALFFGDGGILAFGANCFNMAFVLPFVGYGIYRLIAARVKSGPNSKVAIVVGSYVGINVAALCAAIEFGVQPLLFTNAAGQALYCPYPLSISIPAMLIPHLLVAGVIEAIATIAIYSYVQKVAPSFIQARVSAASQGTTAGKPRALRPVYLLVVALIALTPLGLIAAGTAWGEWDAEGIISEAGASYVPFYLQDGNGFSWSALMPDYSLSGLPEAAGYILSAVVGVALLVIVFRVVGALAIRNSGAGGSAVSGAGAA